MAENYPAFYDLISAEKISHIGTASHDDITR